MAKSRKETRKAFVQARLAATGKEATPEQLAKFRQRFQTLSQSVEGRTKIAQQILPEGTATERKVLKKMLRETNPTRSTSAVADTGGSSGGGGGGGGGAGGTPKPVSWFETHQYPPRYGSSTDGTPKPVSSYETQQYLKRYGYSGSTTSPVVAPTTSTTIPKSTTSTTIPKIQSNAFKSTGPTFIPSDEKDLTVPIVGGILATGAAAVGTKKFLSSTTNIDRMLRVRQNELARQFKASQLTNSSTLSLADRPQFGTVAQQRAAAAAKAAAARPVFGTVAEQRAAARAAELAARPVFGTVAEQRAAAAAKAAAAATVTARGDALSGRTPEGGTRSLLEGLRNWIGGGPGKRTK